MITRRDAVSGMVLAVVSACTHGARSTAPPSPPPPPAAPQPPDAPPAPTGPVLGLAMITDECINCGACEPECPNQAISEGPDVYEVNQDACTECVGFQGSFACQAVCPVECCLPDPAHAMTEAELLARAQALHPDETFPALADLTADQSLFRQPES